MRFFFFFFFIPIITDPLFRGRYLDRLATSMLQNLVFAERMEQRKLGNEARRESLRAQQREVHEKTKKMLAEATVLQKRMETWLTTTLRRIVRIAM